MKIPHLLAVLIGATTLLSACGTTSKIAALKPEASYTTDIVYDKQISYANIPLEIQVADVQNQTNTQLSGLIYEDANLEDDKVMLKVWKEAPIVIKEVNGRLAMELPLKIWVKVKYGIDKFGLSVYDTREVNLNGVIKLNSAVAVQNWKLVTQTQIEDIDWIESPSIVIAGRELPITYLINPVLSIFKGKLAKKVDDAIAQSFDIKPYVVAALEQLAKPIQVNPEYKVWVGMQPIALYASPTTVANQKISFNLGMKAYIETSINAQPSLKFDKTQLNLLPNTLPTTPDFSLSVANIITYANAAALVQQNFAGQTFSSGKRAVTINHIDLWGKEEKLVVALSMTGTVNGTFYLSGIPKYDASKQEVYLDGVDFVLDSKNKLLKTGDWLVHGLIAKKIQGSCRFSIAEYLTNGQKTAAAYLNGYQPVKGIHVSGALTTMQPCQLILTPQAIITMLEAKGKVAIKVDGLD